MCLHSASGSGRGVQNTIIIIKRAKASDVGPIIIGSLVCCRWSVPFGSAAADDDIVTGSSRILLWCTIFYSIIVGGDNTLSGGGAWTHRAEQRIVQSWQMIMAGWHGPLFDGLWIILFRILNSFFLSTTIRNKRRSYGRVLDQAVVWQTYTIWSSLDQVFRFSLSHSHRVDRLIQSPHFSSSPNFDWVGWSTREWCKDGGIQLVNHRRVITGTKFICIHSVAW